MDFPRDLYLNAEDILKAKPGTPENDLAIIRNGRFGAFRHVTAKAEDFGAAVKALKAFDRTGNVGSALGHLEDTFHDLQAVTRNLINDIEAAENRYQEASIAWPEPEAPTSATKLSPLLGAKLFPFDMAADAASNEANVAEQMLTDEVTERIRRERELETAAPKPAPPRPATPQEIAAAFDRAAASYKAQR